MLKTVHLCLFLFSTILFSCTFYPKYERPCLEIPEQWRVQSDEASTIANIRWWEQLQDPVLNDLIKEALYENNDLWIATARIKEFRARLGIVNSQFYPQIAAQGNVSRQRVSQTIPGMGGFGGEGTSSGGGDENFLAGLLPGFGQISPYSNNYLALLAASYEVDLWGRIRSASSAAYADLLVSIEARRTVILSVVASVSGAYIQLRQYDLQMMISLQTAKSRKYSLELATVRYEEGLTSELEVKQAASEYDQALLQVIKYKTLIPQQENLLSVLIGHPPQAIQRGRSVEQWVLPPQVPAGIPADILEQRPDIQEAEEQLIAANYRIGEARALFFPDITLTGNYGNESAFLHQLFTGPSLSWQWMANLLQPVFTGWRITSTVDLTKAQKEEALYNYQQTILTALREVDDALIAHQNAKEAVIVERNNVKDLVDYLALSTLQYENGLVDYLYILDAQRRLFEAQLQQAEVEATVFLTLVNIYKALGGGWVVDAENIMLTHDCNVVNESVNISSQTKNNNSCYNERCSNKMPDGEFFVEIIDPN